MVKQIVLAGCLSAGIACAQEAARSGRDNFMQQQAYAEMQRVSGQVDVLQNNHEELVARVAKAEAKNAELLGEIEDLRAEIAALKNAMVEVTRTVRGQRDEIVTDLTKRIKAMQPAIAPAAPSRSGGSAAPAAPAYSGPLMDYVVQGGDSLYLIAKAFGTSVAVIKNLNGLKNNNLRAGQTLKVPKPKD